LVSEGPIVDNSIYDGETYDARREMPGTCSGPVGRPRLIACAGRR
jgi:hypothetical protein